MKKQFLSFLFFFSCIAVPMPTQALFGFDFSWPNFWFSASSGNSGSSGDGGACQPNSDERVQGQDAQQGFWSRMSSYFSFRRRQAQSSQETQSESYAQELEAQRVALKIEQQKKAVLDQIKNGNMSVAEAKKLVGRAGLSEELDDVRIGQAVRDRDNLQRLAREDFLILIEEGNVNFDQAVQMAQGSGLELDEELRGRIEDVIIERELRKDLIDGNQWLHRCNEHLRKKVDDLKKYRQRAFDAEGQADFQCERANGLDQALVDERIEKGDILKDLEKQRKEHDAQVKELQSKTLSAHSKARGRASKAECKASRLQEANQELKGKVAVLAEQLQSYDKQIKDQQELVGAVIEEKRDQAADLCALCNEQDYLHWDLLALKGQSQGQSLDHKGKKQNKKGEKEKEKEKADEGDDPLDLQGHHIERFEVSKKTEAKERLLSLVLPKIAGIDYLKRLINDPARNNTLEAFRRNVKLLEYHSSRLRNESDSAISEQDRERIKTEVQELSVMSGVMALKFADAPTRGMGADHANSVQKFIASTALAKHRLDMIQHNLAGAKKRALVQQYKGGNFVQVSPLEEITLKKVLEGGRVVSAIITSYMTVRSQQKLGPSGTFMLLDNTHGTFADDSEMGKGDTWISSQIMHTADELLDSHDMPVVVRSIRWEVDGVAGPLDPVVRGHAADLIANYTKERFSLDQNSVQVEAEKLNLRGKCLKRMCKNAHSWGNHVDSKTIELLSIYKDTHGFVVDQNLSAPPFSDFVLDYFIRGCPGADRVVVHSGIHDSTQMLAILENVGVTGIVANWWNGNKTFDRKAGLNLNKVRCLTVSHISGDVVYPCDHVGIKYHWGHMPAIMEYLFSNFSHYNDLSMAIDPVTGEKFIGIRHKDHKLANPDDDQIETSLSSQHLEIFAKRFGLQLNDVGKDNWYKALSRLPRAVGQEVWEALYGFGSTVAYDAQAHALQEAELRRHEVNLGGQARNPEEDLMASFVLPSSYQQQSNVRKPISYDQSRDFLDRNAITYES